MDDRRRTMDDRRGDDTNLFSVVGRPSSVVMVGPFGLRPKGTMAARALPLARELARGGARVTLVLPPWSYPADSGQTWAEAGVRIVNIALPRLPVPLFYIETTRRLLAATLAEQPDVVHCFKPKAYSGLVQTALWAMRRLGLWQGHLALDEDDWEGDGGWNELEPYPWPMKRFFAWQETWGLRHADTVTVASRALERLALSLGVPRARVVYLPNGGAALADSTPVERSEADTRQTHRSLSPSAPPLPVGEGWGEGLYSTEGKQDAYPNPLPQGEETRREEPTDVRQDGLILLYTRFFEYKVSRVLAVFERVRARVPQARLVVVGQGLFGEERELLDAVEPHPGAARQSGIIYLGWPGEAALPGLFAAADVALYPLDDTLVNRTKSPAKLLQLLHAGVPVVADAVGQAAVYVGPHQGGLLVPPGDVAAMADAVVQVLTRPALRQRLARGAQAWVQRYYTWPALAARLGQVYQGQPVLDDLP